ncbi:MAG: SIS domain-containing protein [Ruminococcaceae bacterium]|nr:SIS domain-containing protein [Oscillospiraceae bacterium]
MNAKQYLDMVTKLTANCDENALDAAATLILDAMKERRAIFVAGNGGSAATANHFAADFGKNVVKGNENRPRVMSLCCNMSSVTAYANDEGYENAFARQLTNWMEAGDVLIVISASGNSPSVVKAAELAHERGGKVIAMTGFTGGKLREISDICLHAPDSHYETVEDAHSVFCHCLVSVIKSSLEA